MPTSTFDIGSPSYHRAPFETLTRMREAGPIVETRIPLLGKCYMVTTHAACSEHLKDADNFKRDPSKAGRRSHAGISWWMPKSFTFLANNMMGQDDPEHRRLRGLVDQAFQRRNIHAMQVSIEAIAHRLIDQFPAGEPVDILSSYARDLPLSVICELLGLPQSDTPKFKQWMAGLTTASTPLGLLRAMPGIYKVIAYLRQQYKHAQTSDDSGLITHLATLEIDGEKLSEDDFISMVFLLFVAGHETTVHLISGGLLALLTHPEQLGALRVEPALMPSCVEECLRYVSPVQVAKPRYVAQDMDYHGHRLKRGESVLAMLASANMDPAKFDAPEKFDIARRPNPHLSFSTGVHFCLGFQLARSETETAFKALLERFTQIELAVPASAIEWNKRFGIRTLKALPVRLQS